MNITYYFILYTNLPKLRRNSVRILPAALMLVIGIASSIMANQAAFVFLLAYTCLVLSPMPRGDFWGSSAPSPPRNWPIAVARTRLNFSDGLRLTQHTTPDSHHTTASRSSPLFPRKHFRFKPTMPSSTLIEVPVSLALAKTVTGPDLSVGTTVTGPSTGSELSQTYTQPKRLSAPPGPPPSRSGLRPLSKTAIAAERKLAKEAKQKAAEEKTQAFIPC